MIWGLLRGRLSRLEDEALNAIWQKALFLLRLWVVAEKLRRFPPSPTRLSLGLFSRLILGLIVSNVDKWPEHLP